MTTSKKRQGLLFILVGPTGAGKNTLMNGVLGIFTDLQQLATATSRAIRPTEQEGREHHFVTEAEFRRMIDNNELLEWQSVHGRLYGVPRGTVENLIISQQDRIADIDVYGAMTVKAFYPDNVVLIFVQPGAADDVQATVRERLEQRGETEAEIENRLQRVEMELRHAPFCDYLIINETVEQAIASLAGIVRAERSRRHLANLKVRQDFPRHPLSYQSAALVVLDGKALIREGQIPVVRVCEGELPGEAAVRAVSDLKIESDNFVDLQTPIHIELKVHKYHETLVFWFVTVGDPDMSLPSKWAWVPLAQAAIPAPVLEKAQMLSFVELSAD